MIPSSLESFIKLKGSTMKSNRFLKHIIIFLFTVLFVTSGFVVAQEKKDKVLPKDLTVTTLKITGID